MQNLHLYCITKEKGHELLDIMWPVCERFHMFSGVSLYLKFHIALCQKLGAIPSDTGSLLGHYFRVGFYGRKFGENDGGTLVYREKNLTHLCGLTARLQKEIEQLHGQPIELIKEAGRVDVSKLDPEVLYVQLTSYFDRQSWSRRAISTTKSRRSTSTHRSRRGLDQQWLRRTLLTVDAFMLSICKMTLIRSENITERGYMPVRVTYRMLRSRVVMMEKAFVKNGEDPGYIKYAGKLRDPFRDLLVINKRGLEKHWQWVRENPAFRMLQEELESRYVSLEGRLADYVK
jgi:hypothetical protein